MQTAQQETALDFAVNGLSSGRLDNFRFQVIANALVAAGGMCGSAQNSDCVEWYSTL